MTFVEIGVDDEKLREEKIEKQARKKSVRLIINAIDIDLERGYVCEKIE